jgi:hypothetical protein|tara:strand:- start:20 stop:370 length:351 start_codon:yes stop_codon:yes gene_type:complete
VSDEFEPLDHTEDQRTQKNAALQENLKSRTTWLRLFFILVFVALYSISRIVIGAVIISQFVFVLITGQKNERLNGLGQGLATYTYHIVLYLTFNTEVRPYPFEMDWPNGPPGEGGP